MDFHYYFHIFEYFETWVILSILDSLEPELNKYIKLGYKINYNFKTIIHNLKLIPKHIIFSDWIDDLYYLEELLIDLLDEQKRDIKKIIKQKFKYRSINNYYFNYPPEKELYDAEEYHYRIINKKYKQ